MPRFRNLFQKVLPYRLYPTLALMLGFSTLVHGQTTVRTADQLQAAINAGSSNIILNSNIVVSTPIYIGTTPSTSGSYNINGNGFSLSGPSSEVFFVQNGNVSLSNTTLSGAAKGGDGGGGSAYGGGAAGLGGAIFIGSGAAVTVYNVQFSSNSATGGSGSSTGGTGFGGGGGLNRGNGGNGTNFTPFNSGLGGGGGNGGNGGYGEGQGPVTNGSGGGGLQSPGQPATQTSGGNGGGSNGGAGGTNQFNGSNGGSNSGGGGSGDLPIYETNGGNGGTNGGGGSGNYGGNGGEYGGGGAGGFLGGNGGFGGGGGAGSDQFGATGGFGGGGGGGFGDISNYPTSGDGGVGGGSPRLSLYSYNLGGGGAAFGGAIFVQAGGSLIIGGTGTFSGGFLTAGAGGGSASGAAAGSDLFLMTGTTTTFAPGAGNTLIFNGTIADDSAASVPAGNTYTPGTAAGASITIGNAVFSGGTVIFNGINTYSGGTNLTNGAVLQVGNSGSLGSGAINFSGGTLQYGTGLTQDLSGQFSLATNQSYSIDTNGNNVSFASSLNSNGGTFTKIGAGTLTLLATNTYSGGTTIQGGTLAIGKLGSIANSSFVNLVGSGAILDLSSSNQSINNLVGVSGSQVFLGNSSLTINTTAFSNFAGSIANPGSLIIQGTGTEILSGTSSYTGGTTISSGTLQIGNGGTTGSIPGDVADNGTLTFNHSDDIAFNGVISGTGNVIQAGGGSLTLNGINTYSGGTILQNGTLVLGNSQALGTGPLTTVDPTVVYNNRITISNPMILNGLTTLEVGGANGATQSGLISGLSGIVKNGTGSLTLSNSNTFTGGSTLNTGSLVIANPNGLGLGNFTQNGGILMTDGKNHTININGNFTQNSGTLALTISSPTTYDQLVVSGKATVGGTLALNLPNGLAPGSGTNITLIKSGQPVSGKFSSVVLSDPSIGAFLNFSDNVTFEPTSTPETLELTQLSLGNLYGNYLTSNEHGAASYIDANDQNISNAHFGNLVAALNSISSSPQALAGAFDQLNPLKFQSFASSTAFNNTPFMVQQFDDYLSAHRSNGEFVGSNGGIDDSGLVVNDPTIDPGLQAVHSRLMAFNVGANCPDCHAKDMKDMVCPDPKENQWNAFASGNVVLGQDFSNSASGLAHADTTSESVQIGADYRITPHLLAGVMFGYGHSGADLDTPGSTARVDTYSPGLYAAYSRGNWYANSLFNYGFSDYTQHRNVAISSFGGTARSNPSGNQLVLNSDGGYDFHSGRFTYGPTMGLEYVHLDINGYSESGLPGADLNVNEDQSDSLRTLLGGHVSYNFSGEGVTFTPHLNASWQHEYLDSGRNITSNFSDVGTGSFAVRSANPSRESALVSLGLDAQINSSISLFSNYTVQAGQSNYFGQSVQAGIRIGF